MLHQHFPQIQRDIHQDQKSNLRQKRYSRKM